MLVASMITWTEDRLLSRESISTVPETLVNSPRTLLTIMWRTEKWTLLWLGSISQCVRPGRLEMAVAEDIVWLQVRAGSGGLTCYYNIHSTIESQVLEYP